MNLKIYQNTLNFPFSFQDFSLAISTYIESQELVD